MNSKTLTRQLLKGALALTLVIGVCGAASAMEPYDANSEPYSKLNDGHPATYKELNDMAPALPMNDRMDRRNNYTDVSERNVVPDRVTKRTDRDARMIDQVQKRIEPYSNISVDAEEGTVRLRGNVDSMQERDEIIRDTRSVGGVQAVESFITINGK